MLEAGGRHAVHSRAALGVGVDAIVQALGLDARSRMPLGEPPAHTTSVLNALATLRAGGALLVGDAPGANVTPPLVLDTAEALRLTVAGTPLPGVELRGEGDVVEAHAPTMMLGYLDDAEATRAALVERDGKRWVRARAVDAVDEAALEQLMAATPGVREAAVLAVRDAAGRRLYAFVAGDAAFVPRHPARVVALDSLPHRPDGSIDREALRRMASVD